MKSKIILEGSLFSECARMNSNRGGMHRLAEDITRYLVNDKNLEIKFANTIYQKQSNDFLVKFISENYHSHQNQILSKNPFLSSNIPKLRGILRLLSEHLSLNVRIPKIEESDLFHSFYYPFTKSINSKKIKKSITFLDIIALRMEGYSENLIQLTKDIVRSIIPNFAISISEFSKQDLLNFNKQVDPDRVFVAPLAASESLFFQNKSSFAWKAVKNKYELPDNYFLSVSSIDRRKNIPHLIKSFSKFVLQEKPKDLFLVLTGNSTYSYSILDELKIDKEVKEKILIVEKFIENNDLSALYSNAICFFFMSLYEGFGLPVLEAMQCGVPVVTSNATSIPEIVDNAGIMLPPDDEDVLCEAMSKMYSNECLRNKYSELGLKRAKIFSWQICAEKYSEIFKNIILNF